jgi:hypothetical protein
MTNNQDDLDRELDAALAKCAAVEPRAGLEQRILANLRTAPAQSSTHASWRWTLAAAVAAVLVLAVALAWRSERPTPPVIANHPALETHPAPETHVVSNAPDHDVRPLTPRPTNHADRPSHTLAAAEPKLDQFPSPQPLSDQEKILASYVAQFHAEAVLIARVANEETERDRMKLIGEPQTPTGSVDRGNQETTNR